MSLILKYPKKRLNFQPASAFGFPSGTSINFGALDPFRAGVSRNITILAHVHYVNNGGNQSIVGKRSSFAANQNQFNFDIAASNALSFDKDNSFMNGVNVPTPYFGWLAISTTATSAVTYTSVGTQTNAGNFQTSGGSSGSIPLLIGNAGDAGNFFGGSGAWIDAVLLFIGNLPDAFIKAVCVNTQGYNPIGNCPISPVFVYTAESRRDYGQDLFTGTPGAVSSGATFQGISSVNQTNLRGANQTLRAQRSKFLTLPPSSLKSGFFFAAP